MMRAPQVRTRRRFLTAAAGRAPASGIVAIAEVCLARAGVVCQACHDACPEHAIRFPLRRGGVPLPTIDQDRCTGCGGCMPVCPVGAIGLPEGRP